MSEWRPIETAPTDGTAVDLWIMRDDGTGFRATDSIFCDIWVIPMYDNQKLGEELLMGSKGHGKITHWMPIPVGPDGEANSLY
jgi:hypothetical protein